MERDLIRQLLMALKLTKTDAERCSGQPYGKQASVNLAIAKAEKYLNKPVQIEMDI
jgi:hypothetical protein